ncbi:hypothetical protein [Variovorax sp. UC122_21]|uniref:hypothetical protein n=1 Tax=Variovorax sp. UC122_21 TaxID=3374554 RepID=UPI003757FC68
MAKKRVGWAVAACLAVVCLIATSASTSPSTSSDYASWASAIGTIAAVFTAVWATFAAEERQRDDALRAARITSVLVAGLCTRLKERVEEFEARLENIHMNGAGTVQIAAEARTLEELAGPTEEQLLRISHAPGDMAVEIATALARLKHAARMLSPQELQRLGANDHERSKEGANRARVLVHSARTSLEAAIAGLNRFRKSFDSTID